MSRFLCQSDSARCMLSEIWLQQAWYDKNFTRDIGQVGTDIANKIASVTLPINPLESAANGLSLLETVAYTLSPSSTQFVIQGITNTDWKGAPPEGVSVEQG